MSPLLSKPFNSEGKFCGRQARQDWCVGVSQTPCRVIVFKITQGIFSLSTEDADSLLGEFQRCMQILDGKRSEGKDLIFAWYLIANLYADMIHIIIYNHIHIYIDMEKQVLHFAGYLVDSSSAMTFNLLLWPPEVPSRKVSLAGSLLGWCHSQHPPYQGGVTNLAAPGHTIFLIRHEIVYSNLFAHRCKCLMEWEMFRSNALKLYKVHAN